MSYRGMTTNMTGLGSAPRPATRKEKAMVKLFEDRTEPCLWCGERVHRDTYFFPYCGRPCKDQGECSKIGPGAFGITDLRELGRMQAEEMARAERELAARDDQLHCHVCLTHPKRSESVHGTRCSECGFLLFPFLPFQTAPSLFDYRVGWPEVR